MKLTIIMPVYNEKSTVMDVIKRVRAVNLEVELLVVDDCSTDGTRELLQSMKMPGVHVFFHDRNRGKGAAIRTAQQHISGDIVVIQDADLEYDPMEYPRLLRPILDGEADAVYGSRFLGGPHRVLFFWHAVGNKCLTLFSNMVTNLNLTDMETGYKAISASLFKNIPLSCERFGFEPEITVKLARSGARMFEVPISYHGRSYADGKKINWKDGVAAFYFIIKFSLFWKPSGLF